MQENYYEESKVYPVTHAVQMGGGTIDCMVKQESDVGNDQSSPFMQNEAITGADARYIAWLKNENIESLVYPREKKCPDCEYSAHTDRGLKSHITRIHKNKNIEGTGKAKEPIKSSECQSEYEEKASHACT